MEFLKNTTWQRVYNEWKRNETRDDIWRQHYARHGFDTWESFRESYIKPTCAPDLTWKIYEVAPVEILDFQCGAFKGWMDLSRDIGSRLFKKICAAAHFKNHKKILALKKKFPASTELIGFSKGKTISIFEGNHRCVAIAQLAIENKIPNTKIFLALAEVVDYAL